MSLERGDSFLPLSLAATINSTSYLPWWCGFRYLSQYLSRSYSSSEYSALKISKRRVQWRTAIERLFLKNVSETPSEENKGKRTCFRSSIFLLNIFSWRIQYDRSVRWRLRSLADFRHSFRECRRDARMYLDLSDRREILWGILHNSRVGDCPGRMARRQHCSQCPLVGSMSHGRRRRHRSDSDSEIAFLDRIACRVQPSELEREHRVWTCVRPDPAVRWNHWKADGAGQHCFVRDRLIRCRWFSSEMDQRMSHLQNGQPKNWSFWMRVK